MSSLTTSDPKVESEEEKKPKDPKWLAELKKVRTGVLLFTPSDRPFLSSYGDRTLQYEVIRGLQKAYIYPALEERVFIILPSAERKQDVTDAVCRNVIAMIDCIRKEQPLARIGILLAHSKSCTVNALEQFGRKRAEMIAAKPAEQEEPDELVLIGTDSCPIGATIRQANQRNMHLLHPNLQNALESALLVV